MDREVGIADLFPVWNKLTQAQKDRIAGSARRQRFEKGSLIHNGSADCTGLVLVESGQLRAFINSEEGREITIYRLLDLDICLFSASCTIRSIQFEIMIEAEKDTMIWVIPSAVYQQIREESAALANYTSEIMAARFTDVMWLMEQILWKSVDKRLAAYLLEESELEQSTVLRRTHEAIGNHMGNPREVITRMLRYFQSEGLVRLSRGTVELLDIPGLEKTAEDME